MRFSPFTISKLPTRSRVRWWLHPRYYRVVMVSCRSSEWPSLDTLCRPRLGWLRLIAAIAMQWCTLMSCPSREKNNRDRWSCFSLFEMRFAEHEQAKRQGPKNSRLTTHYYWFRQTLRFDCLTHLVRYWIMVYVVCGPSTTQLVLPMIPLPNST